MNISRRDILKFAVGSAAGMLITPVPWKVLDDSAIWTQNWPWVPVPQKGEITIRFTTCALCPAGCGLRARCVAGQPVSLSGVAEHPVSKGTLCPIGLAGHHLAYHPARILQPMRRVQRFGTADLKEISLDDAAGTIAAAVQSAAPGEVIAILDRQPGRTISRAYRHFLAHLPGGVYLRGPSVEDATLSVCASASGMPRGSMGFDLENAQTIVSFGAPLFDGWGTPGRMMQLAEIRRKTGRPRIFQVETRQSRTALLADSWIPVRPGTEGVLALGLAHVLVRERLCHVEHLRARASDFSHGSPKPFNEVIERFTPDTVSSITGLSVDGLLSLARTIGTETPTVVLGGGDPAGGPMRQEEDLAIGALNLLLGSVGQKGGIIPRRGVVPENEKDAVSERELRDLPDRSIRVLVLDGAESGHAVPWSLVERKLADEKALIVSLSPYLAGLARHAEILIPSPAFFESWHDIPTPFHSAVNTFEVSAPFLAAPSGTTEPLEVIKKIAGVLGMSLEAQELSIADRMKAHAETLYAKGLGNVFIPSDRKTLPMGELGSFDKFWGALTEGACWLDDARSVQPPTKLSFFANSGTSGKELEGLAIGTPYPGTTSDDQSPLVVMPFGWHGAAGSGQVSPLMSKVYQESGLRACSNQALVNPDTATAYGLKENEITTLEIKSNLLQVLVRYDRSVMPGVIHVAVGPDPVAVNAGERSDGSELLSMCLSDDGRSWRVAKGKVRNRIA